MMYQVYSDAELDFIKNNWPKMSVSEIAEILERPANSIRSKAWTLGLRSSRTHGCMVQKDDQAYMDRIKEELEFPAKEAKMKISFESEYDFRIWLAQNKRRILNNKIVIKKIGVDYSGR